MGDILAQIGRHEWQFNMVGTMNENHTGADVKDDRKAMKKARTVPSCISMIPKTSYSRSGLITTSFEL